MDVLLVSGRHSNPDARQEALAAGERVAVGLRELGCEVRWLCHAPGGGATNGRAGVDLLPVAGQAPGFRKVQARTVDRPAELAFTLAVRQRMPDVVHVLEFGGQTSMNFPWLARRLGARCVQSVSAGQALCHRGTLVNERGEHCEEWDQPRRCLECCLTPWQHGLGSAAAACGRILARLQVLSPFPDLLDFENRLESVLGALAAADVLLVEDEQDLEHFRRTGLTVPMHHVGPNPSPAELLAHYERLYRLAPAQPIPAGKKDPS